MIGRVSPFWWRQMEGKIPVERVEEVMALAQGGCDTIAAFMREELLQRTRHLTVARAAEQL